MYALLKNGILVPAPSVLRDEEFTYVNPTDEVYEAHGYKPTKNTDRPAEEDGFYFTSSWEETETEIVQVWEKVAYPEQPEYVNIWDTVGNILIGKEQ